MRILMLSQFYPPLIGGEEQHVRTLSVELVARGYEISVATLWHPGLAEFELDQGVRVYRIHASIQRLPWLFRNSQRQFAPPFPDPEIMMALHLIIIREKPEIIHAHNWLVDSFLPLKAWSGAKLIITLHNYHLVCATTLFMHHNVCCQGPGITKCIGCAAHYYGTAKGTFTVLSHRIMSLATRRTVDMFLPVSNSVAVGSGLACSHLPFQVIPNFLPDNTIVPQDDSEPYLAQLPATPYLLFVGALGRFKGVDILLHAYASLTNPPPLVLIGYSVPDWPHLEQDCPDNVFVLKNWPHYAVMKAWSRSIMALVPSICPETFCLAVIEAMSVGRPVIASDIGAIGDLVTDGETGFLVPPGNPSHLQQAIEQLLTNPDLRNRMGKAGIHKAMDYQAHAIVPRIEQVYERILL